MPNKNENTMPTNEEIVKNWTKLYLEFINTDPEDLKKKYPGKDELWNKANELLDNAKDLGSWGVRNPEAEIVSSGAKNASDLLEQKNTELYNKNKAQHIETEEGAVTDLELVEIMKQEHLAALSKSYDASTEEEFPNFGEGAKYINLLAGKKNIFKEMIDILKDGDTFGRGSSSEYKEIQRDLKELDSLCNKTEDPAKLKPEIRKYAQVMTASIAERVIHYINSRKQREMKVGINSYQGKRIQCMKQISSKLKTLGSYMKDFGVFYGKEEEQPIPDTYKKMISKKISETTFTRALFAQTAALHAKDPAATFETLAEKEVSYFNDPATKAMASGLLGDEISEAEQIHCWNKAAKYLKQINDETKEVIMKHDKDGIEKAVAKVKKTEAAIKNENRRPQKNLTFLDNMLYEEPETYVYKKTGYKAVDRALFNQMKQTVFKAQESIHKSLAEVEQTHLDDGGALSIN